MAIMKSRENKLLFSIRSIHDNSIVLAHDYSKTIKSLLIEISKLQG